MTPFSTYLEHPAKIHRYGNHHFDTIILDLPFCSIRAHQSYDWSNEEIESMADRCFRRLWGNHEAVYHLEGFEEAFNKQFKKYLKK